MKFIVIKPIITEASLKDAKAGKFTFLVHKDATKTEIKYDVEKLFKVTVRGVSTVNTKRTKMVMTKFGRKNTSSHIKKARVQLQKGQMIPAFEVKEEKKEKKEKKNDK